MSKQFGVLQVPDETEAILWDMDGTLIDSLTFDLVNCSQILSTHKNEEVHISEETIRKGFALSGSDFWPFLFEESHISYTPDLCNAALEEWETRRTSTPMPLNEGILSILTQIQQRDFPTAVVSNCPEDEIEAILTNSGLKKFFPLVVGNEGPGRARKPAPDSYRYAAQQLDIDIQNCVAIEDSIIGLTSAQRSGAHTIAVASGAATLDQLKEAQLADQYYESFT